MDAIASQITSLTIVYSTVYSNADQSKHQTSASLAFVRGMHRWPVNSPHKGPGPCLTNACRKRLVAKTSLCDTLRLTNVSWRNRQVRRRRKLLRQLPGRRRVCRSRKHGTCEPIDMLFHLQKLSQRHRDFGLWRVHVQDMTVEEPLGNFPVNWSAAHGLRRPLLSISGVTVSAFPVRGMPPWLRNRRWSSANNGYPDHGHKLLTRDW